MENDHGAMEMVKWPTTNGCVRLYLIYTIYQLEIIDLQEIVDDWTCKVVSEVQNEGDQNETIVVQDMRD